MKIALKPSLVLLTVSFVVPVLSVPGQSAMRGRATASQNNAPSSSVPPAERPITIHVDLTKTVGKLHPHL
jgi:hypothetical protein